MLLTYVKFFHRASKPEGPLTEVPDTENNLGRHCNIPGHPGERMLVTKVFRDGRHFGWYEVTSTGPSKFRHLVRPMDMGNLY